MRIFEESNPDWLYMQLHMFKRGLSSANQLTDDLIFEVRENGIVVLKFESDEQYFKLFDMHEDDVWFLTALFNPYGSNFEIYDSYRAKEDWEGGYIIRYFNDENMVLLENLKNIIAPHINIQEEMDKISNVLDDMFPKEVDYIVSDYESEMDTAMSNAMEKSVKEELCDIFMLDGIHNNGGCFYKYITSVDNLIKLYDNYNSKGSDLYNLLKKIGHDKSVSGDYYSSMYDYMHSVDFDEKSFNNTVTYRLEKIMEELEDSDRFPDIEGYKKVIDNLTKRYEFNKWYSLPKDKNILFKTMKVNHENNEIEFEYKQKNNPYIKKSMLDLESFNTFLYQPELFPLFD
jgi:hypothetical protein